MRSVVGLLVLEVDVKLVEKWLKSSCLGIVPTEAAEQLNRRDAELIARWENKVVELRVAANHIERCIEELKNA